MRSDTARRIAGDIGDRWPSPTSLRRRPIGRRRARGRRHESPPLHAAVPPGGAAPPPGRAAGVAPRPRRAPRSVAAPAGFRGRGRRAAGRRRLLDDADAGAGADAAWRRPPPSPCTCPRSRTPPAALTPIVVADDAAHQRDVGDGGAARAEAGRGLHEVGAGGLGQRARGDLLLVGQQRRLDDDLAERRRTSRQARVTASMSCSTSRRSPDLSAPTLITMSISVAPSKIARRVS